MIEENESLSNLYLNSLNEIHLCKKEMNDKRVKYIKTSLILFIISIITLIFSIVSFYFQNIE
jgi:hypothetical protein